MNIFVKNSLLCTASSSKVHSNYKDCKQIWNMAGDY